MYVSDLLDRPSVSSVSTSEQKSLVKGTVNILSALEQHKRLVKQWDDSIVPLTFRKLDACYFREWEISTNYGST